MCLTARKWFGWTMFFFVSNLGMGPFLSWAQFFKPEWLKTSDESQGWRLFVFFWFSYPFLHVEKPLAHDYHRHHRVRRWISFNPSCQSYEKPWHRQGPTQCWMPWGAAKWWATDGWMEWFCGEISNTKGLCIFWGIFGGLDGNSTKNLDFTEWFCVVWVNHLGRSKAASFCWLSSWYWYEIVQFNPVTESTPPKINMEPKQCSFGRWFSFSNRWFSRVYLFFRWSFFFWQVGFLTVSDHGISVAKILGRWGWDARKTKELGFPTK